MPKTGHATTTSLRSRQCCGTRADGKIVPCMCRRDGYGRHVIWTGDKRFWLGSRRAWESSRLPQTSMRGSIFCPTSKSLAWRPPSWCNFSQPFGALGRFAERGKDETPSLPCPLGRGVFFPGLEVAFTRRRFIGARWCGGQRGIAAAERWLASKGRCCRRRGINSSGRRLARSRRRWWQRGTAAGERRLTNNGRRWWWLDDDT